MYHKSEIYEGIKQVQEKLQKSNFLLSIPWTAYILAWLHGIQTNIFIYFSMATDIQIQFLYKKKQTIWLVWDKNMKKISAIVIYPI